MCSSCSESVILLPPGILRIELGGLKEFSGVVKVCFLFIFSVFFCSGE
jgi:hypothetical protein